MVSIPAAGLNHTKMTAISVHHPEHVSEISELNQRVIAGSSSSEDLKRFVRLLHTVGETEQSEIILRACIQRKDDEFYGLYTELFSTSAEDCFMRAVEDFQTRFDVHLLELREVGFLQIECSLTIPESSQLQQYNPIKYNKIYTARFAYESPGQVSVDLQTSDDLDALPLDWDGSVWIIPEWYQGLRRSD